MAVQPSKRSSQGSTQHAKDRFLETPSEYVDKRILRTRRLLREAFIELVAEQGYEAVRVEDIIVRADIGRTTFYKHFKDKRDLLQHVADVFNQTYQRNLMNVSLDAEGYTPLAEYTNIFTKVERNADFFRIILEGKDVPLLQGQLQATMVASTEAFLSQQIAQLNLRPTVPIAIMARHFVGALLAIVQWWLTDEQERYTAEEMAVLFQQLHEQGHTYVMGIKQD
ncbi:MAG: TetR/AcrR family transcriptional regulator [Chloroflexota bacterium]